MFMASISAAGDKIIYSGALISRPIAVAPGTYLRLPLESPVEAAGYAYFAGNVGGGLPLPATSGVVMSTGSFTGFAAKINPGGSGLSYLTYLPKFVSSIALDQAADLYLAGANPDTPIVACVSKLNPSASGMLWTNNLNGLAESALVNAVDSSGNVWVTGSTSSSSFPIRVGRTVPEFLVAVNSVGNQIFSALYPAVHCRFDRH